MSIHKEIYQSQIYKKFHKILIFSTNKIPRKQNFILMFAILVS